MMKEITLVNGGSALVDDVDYDVANKFRWRRGARGYVERKLPRLGRHPIQKTQYLHHLICPVRPGMECDHRNGNPLDCTRDNLREVTHAQNMMNRKLPVNNKSGCKGVSQIASGKWIARIQVAGRKIHLGRFTSFEEARLAYTIGSKKHHQEFSRK